MARKIGFDDESTSNAEGKALIASGKGVIHSPLGRPGNQAFDNVVKKIKADPGKYTSSGMGSHVNVSDKH